MRAAIVSPGRPDSLRLAEVPRPQDGPVLVRVHQVGLDGTDAEIVAGKYGEAPAGEDYLVIGHESLGRVEEVTGEGGGLAPGDWVVATVRRPDPDPCPNCAAGEWDMCLNGRYTERGIKGRHGFLAEYYAERPEFLVKVPEKLAPVAVLLEPLSIVEKALEQIGHIQGRMVWRPRRALVLGAGPIGLLGTLLLRLQGLKVDLYDLVEKGAKREVGEAAGARYIWAREHPLDGHLAAEIGPIDIVVEATGYSPLAFQAIDLVGPNGIVCLTGVSSGSRTVQVAADHLNLEMVLLNKVVFGTVSANRRHFLAGLRHLAEMEARWPGLLGRMVTRRLTLDELASGWHRSPEELKTVVEVGR